MNPHQDLSYAGEALEQVFVWHRDNFLMKRRIRPKLLPVGYLLLQRLLGGGHSKIPITGGNHYPPS